MNAILIALLLGLFFASLSSEQSMSSIDRRARALWEAHDNKASADIYRNFLSDSLPPWQRARVLYNLGTIYLSQQHPIEALSFFQKVNPSDLSLPNFAGQLFQNMGIAYLQYAESLASDDSSLPQQTIFITQSLKALDRAKDIFCQLEEEEMKESPFVSCQLSTNLKQWLKLAQLNLNKGLERQRQQLKQSIQDLASLTYEELSELQKFQFDYEMSLLQEELTGASLEQLITRFNSLKQEKAQSTFFKRVKENLQRSMDALQNQQSVEARFYLLAGLSQMNALNDEDKKLPVMVLQQALSLADRTLQLYLLSELIDTEEKENKRALIHKILEQQQQMTLNKANFFIPSVLKEQENRYKLEKSAKAQCQEAPWNQVIPLFDRGFRSLQRNEILISHQPLDMQKMIAHQQLTLKDWAQALKLLLNPPQKDEETPPSQKTTESFRLIQDMYMQDQPQSQAPSEELHSW